MNMKKAIAYFTGTRTETANIDWQAAYESNVTRVYHFFCYKVGNIDLAEELTALTFEKAWMGRSNYNTARGEIQAWLMGIARNVVADQFRKRQNEVSLERESVPEVVFDFEKDIQEKMDFQYIFSVLQTYPERERELIALKYGSELTNREIARLTGISESNVGTILSRVVKKLRTAWEMHHER